MTDTELSAAKAEYFGRLLRKERDVLRLTLQDTELSTDEDLGSPGNICSPAQRELDGEDVLRLHAELTAVDAALRRIEQGTYGKCAHCGQPIAPKRLRGHPSEAACAECAASHGTRADEGPGQGVATTSRLKST
jgi:DnaK suppressor protein